MYKVESKDYPSVQRLFGELSEHLAVLSVLEGQSLGGVYVDDPGQPRSGLLQAGHRFYLAGRVDNLDFNREVCRFFAETVYPEGRAEGAEGLTLYFAPAAWEAQMDAVMGDKLPALTQREFYACDTRTAETAGWRERLPEGFELRLVDAALFEAGELEHLDELREEMCSERASVDDFLAHSFGVCLVYRNELAGWCLSEYNCSGGCEIGIATLDPYQQRGLATLMTLAFVEHAAALGITHVGWHCFTRNVPSGRTALKAGFTKISDYPMYLALFAPQVNLAVHGNLQFEEERYDAALAWYRRALSAAAAPEGEAPGWIYWRAACAAGMLEQPEAAMGYLRVAVARGFSDPERIRSSPYLKSLHNRAEWQALLQELAGRRYSFRLAVPADIPALSDHRRRMFEDMGFLKGREEDPADLDAMEAAYQEYLHAHLAGGSLLAWVAEEGGGIVASGALTILSGYPPHHKNRSGKFAYMHSVYTLPEHRRQGLARRIMELAIEFCRQQGFSRLKLNASQEGRPLYEALGFEPTTEMALKL